MAKRGRPTKYSLETIEKAREYLDEWRKGNIPDDVIPSIEGFSVYSEIPRRTIYDWKSQHKDFSHILENVLSIQANTTINKGLIGKFNSNIAKLLLGKHGYSDRTDITTKGEALFLPNEEEKRKADKALDEI